MATTPPIDQKIQEIISNVLSTELLKEILQELIKYDVWKDNLVRNHIKSKKPNAVNRDQLMLFFQAEQTRLTEASVYLQYVFVPQLTSVHNIQTPYVTLTTMHTVERRMERELDKLTDWVVKQKDIETRFREFITKSKSKVPVHKQDHDPVRKCSNERCNGIALFKHMVDSLVCVSCGTKQTYLDNNFAYGEEVVWQPDHEHKKRQLAKLAEDEMTIKDLLDVPQSLDTISKQYDLSNIFHYPVEAITTMEMCTTPLSPDTLTFIHNDRACKQMAKLWKQKPSNVVFTDAIKHMKQYFKHVGFKHTSNFLMLSVFAMLDWVPPPLDPQHRKILSQSMYIFCVALMEFQREQPTHRIAKLKRSNFRKYVLLHMIRQQHMGEHLQYMIPLCKQDKQNELYRTAFETLCHYINSKKY
jgi:hypothetical protein